MSLQEIKEINMAVKEVNEIALYASFANSVSYAWFGMYAIPFLVYPLLIVVYFLNAIIDLYELYKSPDRSFDKVFGAVCNVVGTSLALSSMIGTLVLGVFAVGPILFLTAVVIGFSYQVVMATINVIRAMDNHMDIESSTRFKQAVILNTYNSLLLACIIIAVIGVLITPFNSIAVATFSIAAAVLMACSLLNRIKSFVENHQVPNVQKTLTEGTYSSEITFFKPIKNDDLMSSSACLGGSYKELSIT
ncbi:MAG: hypothetical protein P1U74_10685 [Legionellaceae bacterium]|nr:hypothetical protein [Legionellaceae bacterium]